MVLDRDGRILLIEHSYRPGWHFPGGGVERNEQVETALIRELDEEAAIRPTGPAELFGLYANFRAFPSDHVALFVVRDFEHLRPFTPTREVRAVGFFAPEALPDGTIGPVRRRLAELGTGARRDAAW
jgi:8-oxo-dGTP pyrophosphatase MutT (NUDIX family)